MKKCLSIKLNKGRNYTTLIWVVYLLLTLVVTVQQYSQGYQRDFGNGFLYTAYNNHLIFKYSFFHLRNGENLYIPFVQEHFDLFKYSPAFALFYGIIAYLPDWLSLFFWIALNAFSFLYVIGRLPFPPKYLLLISLGLLPELLIALQNTQSNALMVALILAGWLCLEKRKYFWAACFFVGCGFIKIYGGLGFLLFLFYPQKIRFLIWSLVLTLFFTFIPLVVTDIHTLLWQYENWWQLLKDDKAASIGLSLSGVVNLVYNHPIMNVLTTILGMIVLIVQTIFVLRNNTTRSRLLWVGLLLVWLVIFNHKAESPTFIIALSGVAIIIYFLKNSVTQIIWGVAAVILTSLAMGDLLPHAWRVNFIAPLLIKVWPSIIVYFLGMWLLHNEKYNRQPHFAPGHFPY